MENFLSSNSWCFRKEICCDLVSDAGGLAVNLEWGLGGDLEGDLEGGLEGDLGGDLVGDLGGDLGGNPEGLLCDLLFFRDFD